MAIVSKTWDSRHEGSSIQKRSTNFKGLQPPRGPEKAYTYRNFVGGKVQVKITHNVFLLKDRSFNYVILNFHEILLLTKGDVGLDASRVCFASMQTMHLKAKIQIDFTNK